MKNWKTTIIGTIGVLVTLAGVFFPDKIDNETGELIKTAINDILIGIGSLISIVNAWKAKD